MVGSRNKTQQLEFSIKKRIMQYWRAIIKDSTYFFTVVTIIVKLYEKGYTI